MSPRRRKFLKILAFAGGGLVLSIGTLLVAFRVMLVRAPDYRAQVEAWVSERTNLHIQFARMDARWRFYGPELVFEQAVVMSRDRKRTFVSARSVSVGYDIWTAIGTLRLTAGRIAIEAPELQVVRTEAGRFEVVGQQSLPDRDPNQPFEPDAMPTGRLQVIDARVSFRDLKANRGPWVVPGVSFDLRRRGDAMNIEGAAELPASLGKSLRFQAETAGRLAQAQQLTWRFVVDARDLNLAGWATLGPKDSLAPTQGRGSFKLSGAFQGANVDDLAMQARFEKISLTLPAWSMPLPVEGQLQIKDEQEVAGEADVAESIAQTPTIEKSGAIENVRVQEAYDAIAFDLTLAHRRQESQDVWDVRVKELELSRPGQPWRGATLALNVKRGASQSVIRSATLDEGTADFSVDARADRLTIENIWPLLAYLPESKTLAHARALSASGQVRDLNMRYARVANAAPTYSIDAHLNNVGFKAIDKIPGFTNFSGGIAASENGGNVTLNVRDGAMALPTIFRTALPVERITGSLNWQREPSGWRVAASELEIDSVDGHARAVADVFLPADKSSPVVDIKATGYDLQARAAPRYMPAGKLGRGALAWLDRAFTDGRVTQAAFELRGPVRDFPFRNDAGLFLIKAHIEELVLDYQPGWTPATGLTIEAEFRNQGLTATVSRGDVNGLSIKSATGRFVDFKDSEMSLDAEAEGDLAQALPYLQQSPVGPTLGETFMALRGQGELRSTVRLQLPFKNIEQRKLIVDAAIDNAAVNLVGLAQGATRVAGKVIVQDRAIKTIALKGELLQGPVTVSGGVDSRYTGAGAGVALAAQGRAAGAELAELLHLPKSVPMSGNLAWQLRARFPRHAPDEPSRPTVSVVSDGKGLAVELPEPIGKRAEQARELRLDIETGDEALLVRSAFGKARALARLIRRDDAWAFDRAGLRVDGIAAALPAHEGLRIEGDIERFVLDDWLKIKSDRAGGRPLSDYLRAANVRVGQFGLYGYDWSDVRGILQADQGKWRVDVAGDSIAGQLFIPYSFENGAALELNLAKLDIGKRSGGGDNKQADPRDVPALRGHVDALHLSGRSIGIARVVVDKTPQGVKLSSLELRGPSFTANAHGAWSVEPGSVKPGLVEQDALVEGKIVANASLTLDIASTDVRQTLQAFDYRDVITGKQANVHAALSWPGGIDEDFIGRASGVIRIELADGQLLEVEPGAGRMLGLLSVAALPRRLSFDFSDVTDKGFSFDALRGDFELRAGDAFTNNLLLRGPAGEVGIVGRTGLGKRDYDLTAVVAGDIGGSLSVAGTVVGGPVVGAAVLAFTRLFKEPLKGVARRYYRIAGPWDRYTYERIDKAEARQNSAATDETIHELSDPGLKDEPGSKAESGSKVESSIDAPPGPSTGEQSVRKSTERN